MQTKLTAWELAALETLVRRAITDKAMSEYHLQVLLEKLPYMTTAAARLEGQA